MKPAPFDYLRPESLEEALTALADDGAEAKVLAGGQSLMPALNMRLLRPGLLVDVNREVTLDSRPVRQKQAHTALPKLFPCRLPLVGVDRLR